MHTSKISRLSQQSSLTSHLIKRAHSCIRDIRQSKMSERTKRPIIALAEKHKSGIVKAIESEHKQHEIFGKLEAVDGMRRDTLKSLIEQKVERAGNTKKIKLEKALKRIHGLHDRQNQTIMKHKSNQLKAFMERSNKSQIYAESMAGFLESRTAKLRSQGQRRQFQSTYQQAQMSIAKREISSHLFAQHTEYRLDQVMRIHTEANNPQVRAITSKHNTRIRQALRKASQFSSTRHQEFLQNYHLQMEKAQQKIQKKQQNGQARASNIRKFLSQHFSKTQQRSKTLQADRQAKQQRLFTKLNESNENSVRGTSTSSFQQTCRSWAARNSIRKDYLKQIQYARSNAILDKHQTLSKLRKQGSRVDNTMTDLRRTAHFCARQF